MTEQSMAEEAEKSRKREEGSTACQEGLERLSSVGKWGMRVWGESCEENQMISQSWDQKEPSSLPGENSSQPAASKAEPQSPDLCWAWGQRDRAGPTLHPGVPGISKVCPQPGKGAVFPGEAAWPLYSGHLEMPLLPF